MLHKKYKWLVRRMCILILGHKGSTYIQTPFNANTDNMGMRVRFMEVFGLSYVCKL